MEERFLRVPRTARYHLLGDPASAKAIWIVVHGYGQLARFFLGKFEGLEDDLLIVAPEGLSRFYLDEAHQRVGATWMTREDREHEIQDHVAYLDMIVDVLRLQCPHASGVNVLGFSQGVATASRWAALGQSSMHRMILWGGNLPPDLPREALSGKFRGLHFDLVQGAKDEIVPPTVLTQNAALLQSMKVPHRVHAPAVGHGLEPVLLGRLLHEAIV